MDGADGVDGSNVITCEKYAAVGLLQVPVSFYSFRAER